MIYRLRWVFLYVAQAGIKFVTYLTQCYQVVIGLCEYHYGLNMVCYQKQFMLSLGPNSEIMENFKGIWVVRDLLNKNMQMLFYWIRSHPRRLG